jgi:SOS-response transcriptional repressor LexA
MSSFMTEEMVLRISSILGRLLKSHSLNESALGRKTGIPRATINRLLSGKTPNPGISTLSVIAQYFDITLDQLVGKQAVFGHEDHKITSGSNVPILDWSSANNWQAHLDNTKKISDDYKRIHCNTDSKSTFALKIHGESMWPQFANNCIIIVDTSKKTQSGDFVMAHLKKNKENIFRRLIIEGNYKLLVPINSIFPSIHLTKSDEIIGKIIETINIYE